MTYQRNETPEPIVAGTLINCLNCGTCHGDSDLCDIHDCGDADLENDWLNLAFQVFGYRLGGYLNHHAIAEHLKNINNALDDDNPVTLTVTTSGSSKGEIG